MSTGDEGLTGTRTRRVIPFPQEAEVTSEHVICASDLSLRTCGPGGALVESAKSLMSDLCRGRGSAWKICFARLEHPVAERPPVLKERLLGLPNADQAYAVVPEADGSGFSGLLWMAPTDLGLLYGARTLRQLIAPTVRRE
jgi:hypothetical protein